MRRRQVLATGGLDTTVRLWNPATEDQLRALVDRRLTNWSAVIARLSCLPRATCVSSWEAAPLAFLVTSRRGQSPL